MRLNGTAVTVVTTCAASLQFIFAKPIPTIPTAQDLLKAPIVTYSTIVDINMERDGTIPHPFGTSKKQSLLATIKVDFMIQGAVTNNTVKVRQVFDPDIIFDHQLLAKGKHYVFFLSEEHDTDILKGITEYEFALECGQMPLNPPEKLSKENALRVIAQISIASTNEVVAARWIDFIAGQSEENNDELFVKQLSSTYMSVRGIAIAALCRRTSVTPDLYGQAMAFLKASPTSNVILEVRRKIVASFVDGTGSTKLSNAQLREWLASDIPELPPAGLQIIKRTRYTAMLPEVVNLMQRTPDRDLQYGCISAICAIDSQSGPSYRMFMSDPNKYVLEAAERHAPLK